MSDRIVIVVTTVVAEIVRWTLLTVKLMTMTVEVAKLSTVVTSHTHLIINQTIFKLYFLLLFNCKLRGAQTTIYHGVMTLGWKAFKAHSNWTRCQNCINLRQHHNKGTPFLLIKIYKCTLWFAISTWPCLLKANKQGGIKRAAEDFLVWSKLYNFVFFAHFRYLRTNLYPKVFIQCYKWLVTPYFDTKSKNRVFVFDPLFVGDKPS